MNQTTVVVYIKGQNRELDQSLQGGMASLKKFKSFAIGAFAAIGGFVAIKLGKELFNFGKQLFDLYDQQERAERRVESVIRATGAAAGFNLDQQKRIAAALQNQLGIGDEVLLQTQAIIGTFRNIRGEEFKDATVLANDMATVLGTDAKSAAIQLGKALNDPLKGITALSRAGVTFSQQQKDQIAGMLEMNDVVGAQRVIIEELQNQFGGATADQAKTFGGRIQSLKNRLGDMGEQIFGALIPALEEFLPYLETGAVFLENLTKKFTSTDSAIGSFVSVALIGLNNGMQMMVEVGIYSFTALQTAIENWQLTSQIAVDKFLLAHVRVFNELHHLLTRNVPEGLKWLHGNWREVFNNLGMFTHTVLKNMGKNVINFFRDLKNRLQGKGGSFEFTALTDGFELTFSKLPEFTKRQIGGFEKSLQERLGKNMVDYANKFDKNLRDNTKEFFDLFKKEEKEKLEDIKADEEALRKEREVSKKNQSKRDKDQTGQFESLEGLSKRIAEAAGALGAPKGDKLVADKLDGVRDALMGQTRMIEEKFDGMKTAQSMEIKRNQNEDLAFKTWERIATTLDDMNGTAKDSDGKLEDIKNTKARVFKS